MAAIVIFSGKKERKMKYKSTRLPIVNPRRDSSNVLLENTSE
jgi:hypothetical protein